MSRCTCGYDGCSDGPLPAEVDAPEWVFPTVDLLTAFDQLAGTPQDWGQVAADARRRALTEAEVDPDPHAIDPMSDAECDRRAAREHQQKWSAS